MRHAPAPPAKAADIDAADLLLRRAVHVTDAPELYSPTLLARSVRDFARVSELTVAAVAKNDVVWRLQP